MTEFFAALLYFSTFLLALYLGSLTWISFQTLVSSDSLGALRPSLRKIHFWLIPTFILFLILSFGISDLYSWTQEQSEFAFRNFYLNPWSLRARTFLEFILWAFLSYRYRQMLKTPAALAFLLLALTSTFVSVDWLQSLDSHFRSSAFGLIFFFSAGLLALGFHLMQISNAVSEKTLIKLNNIHLAMIGSWAYLNFMQFLIIWSGNIPAESNWFVSRLRTDWAILPSLLAVFQFAVPLFLLFFRSLKKSPLFTRRLGLLTVFMQTLNLIWLIFPSIHSNSIHFSIWAVMAILLTWALPFLLPKWSSYEPT